MDQHTLIKTAYHDAQSRRPHMVNDAIIGALMPDGGYWTVVARSGAICRSVMWGHTQVAYMNPKGQIFDETEGQIAMAFRAMPVTDVALRSIIVLAENPENLALIRSIAESVIAYIELPAPKIEVPEEDEDWAENDLDGEEPGDGDDQAEEKARERIEDMRDQEEIKF